MANLNCTLLDGFPWYYLVSHYHMVCILPKVIHYKTIYQIWYCMFWYILYVIAWYGRLTCRVEYDLLAGLLISIWSKLDKLPHSNNNRSLSRSSHLHTLFFRAMSSRCSALAYVQFQTKLPGILVVIANLRKGFSKSGKVFLVFIQKDLVKMS